MKICYEVECHLNNDKTECRSVIEINIEGIEYIKRVAVRYFGKFDQIKYDSMMWEIDRSIRKAIGDTVSDHGKAVYDVDDYRFWGIP